MESKYTKAERRKIYLKAASKVYSCDNKFCCDAIRNSAKLYVFSHEVTSQFPEFGFFEPEFEYLFCKDLRIWWHENEKEARLIALLLCAEMCND